MKKVYQVLLVLFFFCTFALFMRTIFGLSQTLTPDFSVHYQAAKNLLSNKSVYIGHTLFTIYAYPLVSALLIIPLALLPYTIAQNIFLLYNIVALIITSFIIPLIIFRKKSYILSAIIFSFSYLSFPTKFTFGMGQINLIAYALLLISFFMYQKKKIFWTACFFTVACIAKPILGFTILFFIFRKQWKVILIACGIGSIFILLSLLVDKHATQDYIYYFQHVIPQVSKPGGQEVYYNQGFMGFIFRTLPIKEWRVFVSHLGMILILLIGLITIFKQKKNEIYIFSLLLTMIPLLDTMSWQHHFVFLILPFVLATYVLWKAKKYILLILLGLAYLLVSANIKSPQLFTQFPQNLILSNTFYGAFLLFILLLFIQKVSLKK